MRPAGFKHTDEIKKKIAASLKGTTKSAETRAKIAASVSKARQKELAVMREEASRRESRDALAHPALPERWRIERAIAMERFRQRGQK